MVRGEKCLALTLKLRIIIGLSCEQDHGTTLSGNAQLWFELTEQYLNHQLKLPLYFTSCKT